MHRGKQAKKLQIWRAIHIPIRTAILSIKIFLWMG